MSISSVVLCQVHDLIESAYILRYVEHCLIGVSYMVAPPVCHLPQSQPRSERLVVHWILVRKSKRTENCVEEYVRSVSNLKRASPFELYVSFIDVALALWRQYIVYSGDCRGLFRSAICSTCSNRSTNHHSRIVQ